MFSQNNVLNRKIADLGKKYGLNAEESYDIMRHQFKIVHDMFAEFELDNPSTHKNARIMHLGIFESKSSVKVIIKRLKINGK